MGCVTASKTDKADANGKSKPKTGGHTLSEKEAEKMIADVKADMRVITQVRNDPEPLEEALDKGALEDMVKQVESDVGEGKIKVRRFGSVKYKLGDYAGGIGGIEVTYKDDSFYESPDGARLTEPSGEKTTVIVATQKIKGRWKIVGFYSPETKEPPGRSN